MKAALRASMKRIGLHDLVHRLLDEKKTTRDVTPPPHITPCGMQRPTATKASGCANQPGARLAAATAKPRRSKKPAHLDDLLRDAGVRTARDEPPLK